jgi:PAS domain S-box-containing protein
MRDTRQVRRIVRRLWPRFGGALLTVCAAAILELVSGTVLRIPNPPAILLLTTVYSTFSGGLRAGLISAALSWLYLAYFFDNPGAGLAYSGDNFRRLVIWAVSLPAIVLMIGTLKRRAEYASDEIVRRERERSEALETALAERRRSEESLRALFDRNLAGMFRSRRDGRVLECNAAFVRLLGYRSREEVLARNAREFYLDAKDRERLLRLVRPGAVVTNEELQLQRADGTPLWGLVHLREIVDGPSTYLEGVVIDITERKVAELTGHLELHELGRREGAA